MTIETPNICITGLSGRFPEAQSVEEFRNNLFAGVDMVTEDDRRWKVGIHGLPGRNGKLKKIDEFDAAFFGISPEEAEQMDPGIRIMLEVTYEAIVDAGIDPQTLRGSNTGVFVGTSNSEALTTWASDTEPKEGFVLTGSRLSMIANQISYHFDLRGPSSVVDSGCSAGLLTMNHALEAMRTGQCDTALVTSVNMLLKPHTSMPFHKLSMLAPDGTCRSFDAKGSGYVRSEAAVSVLLQRRPASRRVYCSIIHCRNNCDGFKDKGITFPSGAMQKKLLQRIYKESGIEPATVSYVETHGTGTRVGDPQELGSIADVFCNKNRNQPLLIGSTKSNMGHPEPTSGMTALAKVLISIEERMIPANIHFHNPNPEISALRDGRLQVVDKHTPLHGEYIGINSFGFGGTNVHCILKFNADDRKVVRHPAANHLRLFTMAARTEEGLGNILSTMQEKAPEVSMQQLLQNSANSPAHLNPYRGYALLNSSTNQKKTQRCVSDKRPLWYVFAGMGAQWGGMAQDMMGIEVFRQSLEKSDAALKPHGYELIQLIQESTEDTFKSPLHSFTLIAAIQVALVDVLRCVGVEPDGIVGHSMGEIACSYADGGLTAEQTVQVAYWIGRCMVEGQLDPGSMAAVGLTWAEVTKRLPQGVDAVCNNAEDSVTISGPREAVAKWVKQLQDEGVFAKEVACAGVGLHSHMVKKIEAKIQQCLAKVIPEKKARTSRWVSTSVPTDRRDGDLAKYCSAEYHTNNFVNTVYFYEALQCIPENAITVEVAPHSVLQAIVKRAMGAGNTYVALMKRDVNGPEHMLSSLGELYASGVNIQPMKLYPAVEYPVARGTPMLASLLKWDHSKTWPVPSPKSVLSGGESDSTKTSTFIIDTSLQSDDRYLVDHKIDGRVLFPATGYLVLAWQTLAHLHDVPYEELPVHIEDVTIFEATVLSDTTTVTFHVSIAPGTGTFEVRRGDGNVMVTGTIDCLRDPPKFEKQPEAEEGSPEKWTVPLDCRDIYNVLRLIGYDYGPEFQNIIKVDRTGLRGNLRWNGYWIAFIDSMIQMGILNKPWFQLPTRVRSLKVDPQRHLAIVDESMAAPAIANDTALNKFTCGGVEITGTHCTVAPRRKYPYTPTLLEYKYLPFNQHFAIKGGDSYMEECHKLIKEGINNVSSKDTPLMKCLSALNDAKIQPACASQAENMATVESEYGSNAFLSFLKDLFKADHSGSFNEHVKELLSFCQDIAVHDKVIGCMQRPEALKACMHTVLENRPVDGNVGEGKVKIVTCGNGNIYKSLIPWLYDQPLLEADYTVIGDVNNFDEYLAGLVEENSVTVSGWDLTGNIPDELKNADLVILDQVVIDVGLTSKLEALSGCVRDEGFLMVTGATNNHHFALSAQALLNPAAKLSEIQNYSSKTFNDSDVRRALSAASLTLVSESTCGILSSMYLAHSPAQPGGISRDMDQELDVSSLSPTWVDDLNLALSGETVTWLRASGELNGIVGMTKALRKELGGTNIRSIFLGDDAVSEEEIKAQKKLDLAFNVHRDGVWGHYVQLPLAQEKQVASTKLAFINVMNRGDLASLRWIESALKHFDPVKSPNLELCNVHYAALNFRDVMLATGKLPPDAIPGGMTMEDCMLGMEFSGTDSKGQRVMGMCDSKALATSVAANRRFIWPVPESWSLSEAASVPVVYCTAYYALVVRGRIRRGDTVLIHSGSGGVGQAAIAIALNMGCTVYTTCGTQAKIDYLKERFPQLKDHSFANSRDCTFETHIMQQTNGRGCDIVLNSLADDKLQASLRLLTRGGRFLEIGKYDLANNTPLGMSLLQKNVSVHGILLDALFETDGKESKAWNKVSALFLQGMKEGVVKPLKTTVFAKEDVEPAFRFMAQGKHIGKVILQIQEDEEADQQEFEAMQKTYCDPDKSYIIHGGLGGFGLEMVDWLVDRGAKHVFITSRSGPKSGMQCRRLRMWNTIPGVTVEVVKNSVGSLEEAEQLIKYAQSKAPVGGLFNLAVVLHDRLMAEQTVETFELSFKPKVQATQYLDTVTRKLCKDTLEWFVPFSSTTSLFGNAGQSNYCFANSYMERLCELRQKDGFPGMAVQWGAIGDVGVAIDTFGSNDYIMQGTRLQRIGSCLATLDHFLTLPQPTVTCYVLSERLKSAGAGASKETEVLHSIAHILGISDMSTVNPEATLAALGLDSLMSLEVKQALETALETSIPMGEINKLTFTKIRDLFASGPQGGGDGGEQVFELMPLKPIVKMATVPNDKIELPLFMIHDMSGMLNFLEPVAAMCEGDVYGIQFTPDCPTSSMEDLATYYIEQIKTIQPVGPYRICGYSFGASLVLEMLRQMAGTDTVSYLVLLDSSPDHFTFTTKALMGILDLENEAETETKALCAFATHLSSEVDYSVLGPLLMEQPDLHTRSQACADYIMTLTSFSLKEEVTRLATMYYKRFLMIYKYEPNFTEPFDQAVTLIKASEALDGVAEMDEYWGLYDFFSDVKVHEATGQHHSFLSVSSKQVADIITRGD